LEKEKERSRAGAKRTFDMSWLTGRQRVRLAWRATCAKMTNLMLKLLLFDKFVIVILRMIFGRMTIVIMVNMPFSGRISSSPYRERLRRDERSKGPRGKELAVSSAPMRERS
jgi:hypothetical protein